MSETTKPAGFVVVADKLPPQFPTHLHAPTFWEALGRTVGTFGYLEETLGKAIFALTATKEIPDGQIGRELAAWFGKLERTLSDPLGRLISEFEKAAKQHQGVNFENLDHLVADLREASMLRNVLCHGSWQRPDGEGRSTPFFVNNKGLLWDGAIDARYLVQLQQATVRLSCAVVNCVTHMGWQFPGSPGPGIEIWPSKNSRS